MGERRDEQPMHIRNQYSGYQVYDRHYEKVGKVDDLFVDEGDRPEYIGVQMGFLGARSTLIPMDIIRINDRRQLMEVATDKETIKEAPTFDHEEEITPEIEDRIYSYFGVTRQDTSSNRSGYGAYYSGAYDTEGLTEDDRVSTGELSSVDAEYGERTGPGSHQITETRFEMEHEREYERDINERSRASGEDAKVADHQSGDLRSHDVEYSSSSRRENRDAYDLGDRRERVGGIGPADEERLGGGGPDREHGNSGEESVGATMDDTKIGELRKNAAADEGVSQPEARDLEDDDELRVQRSEEELRVGIREREAGSLRVRKRVKTEREQIRVPKKREEVSVDRVPVEEGRASEGEIGEYEVRIPVTEEEVIVDKKPVVKEELRIRKDVVEDEEVVEEDVRKEEVEVDDETRHRRQ